MLNGDLYRNYASFIGSFFDEKVQKLAINAGFTCPNRDGTVGVGGCTYCNNQTFNPAYCESDKTIKGQIEEGKKFFQRKYPKMKFLAYFQAFSNTYAPLDVLKSKYAEALELEDIVGIVIGTRPDCVSDELIAFLAELSQSKYVMVEYGIESTSDATLERINRGHSFAQARSAVVRSKEAGLLVGAHMILGLPGETREELIAQADTLSELPLDTLKLHQLQIIRGTRMASEFDADRSSFPLVFDSAEEYASLVAEYIARLRPDIAIERFTSQSPASLLVAPSWGIKNYEFVAILERCLAKRNLWQGKNYKKENELYDATEGRV